MTEISIINVIKERHVSWGITISTIIASVVHVILSIISINLGVTLVYGLAPTIFGFGLLADFQFLTGTVVGVVYSLKNCQPGQPLLKYGIIVGILGGVFSTMIISLYETLLLILAGAGSIFGFFYLVVLFIISGFVIGLIIGAILGSLFLYIEMKDETKVEKDDHLDDDFFKDLIDK